MQASRTQRKPDLGCWRLRGTPSSVQGPVVSKSTTTSSSQASLALGTTWQPTSGSVRSRQGRAEKRSGDRERLGVLGWVLSSWLGLLGARKSHMCEEVGG